MSKPTNASSFAEGGKLGALFTRGSGSGNYTTVSTIYVNIDNGINQTWVVPQGFVLLISFSGVASIATAADSMWVALLDQLADGSGGGIKTEEQINVATASATSGLGFSLQHMIVGDGVGHNVIPQFKANSASHAALILNNSTTHAPTMLCELTQSNVN